MLHIILIILKIIGILLLVIVGLLLFLLFCILFVPIRYQASAEGQNKTWNGHGGVMWLAHIISIKADYVENQLDYEIYILGIPLLKLMSRIKKKKGQRSDPKANTEAATSETIETAEEDASDENVKHAIQKETFEETKESEKIREPENCSGNQESSQSHKSSKDDSKDKQVPKTTEPDTKGGEGDQTADTKKSSGLDRILSVINSILHIPQKIYYTIHNLYDKIQAGILLLKSDEVQHLKKTAILYTKKILKHIRPRRVKGHITYGFDDPALTGQILGGVGIIYAVLPKKLMITPNFEETCFEGQISMSGRIFGICFAVWALQILFDKKTIPAIKRVTHKEG